MESENIIYFNLPEMLKRDTLNTRAFADEFVVTVGTYFSMLLRLEKQSAKAVEALNRFINRSADIDSYKSLDNLLLLLKDLRSERFVTPIYSILGAYDTGNWRLAAHRAEMMMGDFNAFCATLDEMRRKGKQAAVPDPAMPLKEYIRILDEAEANRKPVILAIDDSPTILSSLLSVLGGDYKVFTLPKPSELERVLTRLTPDLFLLDYLMPDINGFELVPIIRSFEAHAETPIIYLTSHGTIDNLTAALALGASDFVVKPFDADILREKIAKHIVKNV